MLGMRTPEEDTPFLESADRRRPGTSPRGYVSRTLPHASTIVVANRAPHEPKPEGGFTRGAGGVITALLTFAEVAGADWVACARNDAERKLIEERGTTWNSPLIRTETRLHYATPTPEQYEQHYSVISNPVLWFIQHYLWDLAHQPVIDGRIHRAWNNGYVEVNKQLALKVVDVARGLPARPLVMVHDYQLYLVPKLVRDQLHGAIIQHFVHIPWPSPRYWKVLPREMRDAILHGLLGCDIVGFQTSLDVRNFLMTCEENAGLAVDERERAVLIEGRVVYARHYPISIDVASTTRLAYSHGVMVEERKLRDWRPEHLIVRVDRTDPSKNIVRGLLEIGRGVAHTPRLLARGDGRGAQASRLAARAPHRARRPHRSFQEHRARLPRLREAARSPSRAARPRPVLGVPAAVSPERGGLSQLRASCPAGRAAHQRPARRPRMAADPARARREPAQSHGRAAQLRRARRQLRL